MSSTSKSGCLGLLFRLFGIAPPEHDAVPAFPYRLRDDFLSPAEVSFYHVLLSAAEGKCTVCPKVNLADIFFVSRPDQNQAARNRITHKHVDFLLCDSHTMRPLAGIELDDATHARPDRQTRDAFVQKVFEAAGLPLLRFPAQRAYNRSEISSQLSQFLAGEAVQSPPQNPAPPRLRRTPLRRLFAPNAPFLWCFGTASAARSTDASIIQGAGRQYRSQATKRAERCPLSCMPPS